MASAGTNELGSLQNVFIQVNKIILDVKSFTWSKKGYFIDRWSQDWRYYLAVLFNNFLAFHIGRAIFEEGRF
jgi:hypothetical protein